MTRAARKPDPLELDPSVDAVLAEVLELWKPPPDITPSQWADEHYYLSSESSGENAGKWLTLPYQREILDVFGDDAYPSVTMFKSARVGYTAMLVAYIGYRIDIDPCAMLIVLPTDKDVSGFSKEFIAPMVRDVPKIAARIAPPKSRTSDNTITRKAFRGGYAQMIGAVSGRGFRRVTIDLGVADELDAWTPTAGPDGEQMALLKKRTETSSRPKIIVGSTGLLKGSSRIEERYDESDGRRYWVPCPQKNCGKFQTLKWGGPDCHFGIKWPREERAESDTLVYYPETATGRHRPELAYYLCEHCAARIEETEKEGMVAAGEWRAERPEVKGHAGFHIWAGYSPFPGARWGVIAEEFLRVQHEPRRLQVFVNTVLGETWEEKYSVLDSDWLYRRRENYPRGEDGRPLVPRGVAVILAAIDVQTSPPRLEMQIEGFGSLEENWKLDYQVLPGDPSTPDPWRAAWDLITKPWPLERGGVGYISATAVDTGGHYADAAYAFCKPRTVFAQPSGGIASVFAIKGASTLEPGIIWPKEPSLKNLAKCPLWLINTGSAKDLIFDRLTIPEPGDPESPAFIHTPDYFREKWYAGLTSEKCTTTYNNRGIAVRRYSLKHEGQANEPLDLSVYSLAMLYALRQGGFDLEMAAEAVADPNPMVDEDARAHAPAARGGKMISKGVS